MAHPITPQPDAALFASLIEISSEAVWVIDFKQGISFWYASAENRLKYNLPNDPYDQDFWTANLHPADMQRAVSGFQNALQDRTTKTYRHTYRFKGKDETCYLIDDTMQFFRDEDGKCNRVVGVWKDITIQRQQQQELKLLIEKFESERNKFKAICEVASAAIWEVDITNNTLYWWADNKTISTFGFDSAIHSLEDWENNIYKEDRARVVASFQSAVANLSTYFETYRFIKGDGSIAWVVDQGIIFKNPKTNSLKGYGSWVDITKDREREEAVEEALRQQRILNQELSVREEELVSTEEELRQINEQLSENIKHLNERDFILNQSQKLAKIGSWSYDVAHKKMTWSDEMYSIYGVDQSFDISNLAVVHALYEPDSSNLVAEAFKHMVHVQADPFDIIAKLITPLGYKKWLRITAYPVMKNDKLVRLVGLTYDTTYFKEAEERLMLSEEKFGKAFRNNPDLMTLTREDDFVIIDTNEKVKTVLGYTREEVIGSPATAHNLFVYEEERQRFYEIYNANGFVELECAWRRKDNRTLNILIASSRLEIEGKKHMISVIKDISDRVAAEEKFERAFSLSPDLILIFKESSKILVEVNSKLETIAGYKREQAIGRSTSDFNIWFNEADRQNFFEGLRRDGVINLEAPLFKKNGSVFYGAIAGQRLVLNHEDHMLVVVRDITEQKKAEQSIRQNEAQLNAIINNTDMLIWSLDQTFTITALNVNFQKFSKRLYGAEFLVGQNIIEQSMKNVPAAVVDQWVNFYKRALSGEVIESEEKIYNSSFIFTIYPIVTENQIIGATIYGRDITERVLREKQIKQNSEALIEAEKKIGELKLTTLRSVMNPHFVFNALNSIQYFIAKNDRKKAISYLSTFSKLIRGVLNHSMSNKISLAAELDLLRHYIDLEKVRFENKFDFELSIDPELDLENIEIPSLLIQPFVENAILHGLNNKADKGVLKINIGYDAGNVLFQIEDNGIGRDEARKLRKQNFPEHKSIGSALTEERLRLINERDNVAFVIEDLFDEAALPVGTRVNIRVRV